MNDLARNKILVVEDNPEDLELILRTFQKAHLTNPIQTLRDGAEALDYIFCEGEFSGRQIADTPRLVLLNLKLPKVDGLEVLEKIKSDPRTRAIPVVMLISSREQMAGVESHGLDADHCMVKPVEFEEFVLTAQRLGLYWHLLSEPPNAIG